MNHTASLPVDSHERLMCHTWDSKPPAFARAIMMLHAAYTASGCMWHTCPPQCKLPRCGRFMLSQK